MSRSAFLTVDEAAELLRLKPWKVLQLSRLCRVPCRRHPFTRPWVYVEPDLRAWMDGAELEVVERPGNGLIVRPKS